MAPTLIDAIVALGQRKEAVGDNPEVKIPLDNLLGQPISVVTKEAVRLVSTGFDLDVDMLDIASKKIADIGTMGFLKLLVAAIEKGVMDEQVLYTILLNHGSGMWIDGVLTGLMLGELREKSLD